MMIQKLKKTGRIYCSPICGINWAHQNLTKYTQSEKGRKRKKEHNPMSRMEVREKVSTKLKEIGHKPPKRGGNGTGMTKPQKILFEELKKHNVYTIPELPIKTHQKVGSGYPTCYKVDLGFEESKIGIEVDGHSHNLIERQKQDIKKDMFLESLGWKILRFKNEEILKDLNNVVQEIMSII
jgi:very-short-patch-repair endonuclease